MTRTRTYHHPTEKDFESKLVQETKNGKNVFPFELSFQYMFVVDRESNIEVQQWWHTHRNQENL